MPEYLRAIIAICFFSFGVFWLAREPLTRSGLLSDEEFVRARNAWFIVTAIAFLSHNFWLFIIITAIFLRREVTKGVLHPFALYCLLLLALPPEGRTIPGFGPIDQILTVDYYRVLSICLLLPCALKLRATRHERAPVPRSIDFCIGGLLVWMLLVRVMNEAPIHILRNFIYTTLDTWLPYYVASRGIRSIEEFRKVAAMLIVGGAILGVIAVFESSRHWLLYSSLPQALGAPEGLSPYLLRSEGGPLRAKVSLGNSIVLGYVLTAALSMALYLGPQLRPIWKRNLAIGALGVGIIASLSRGPWVGAIVMLLVLLALGPGLGKRLAAAIFGGGALVIILLLSPWGDMIVSYLPFVGESETGTVDYRARLFEVSMLVFKQNPIVGDLFYLRNPIMEQMRQGEGIIDMVNTYLQIALPFGAIGVSLFAGIFLSALLSVRQAHKRMYSKPEEELLGRCLIAGMAAIILIIATVSSIGAIPVFYALWAGLCASYVRLCGVRYDSAARRRALRTQPSSG